MLWFAAGLLTILLVALRMEPAEAAYNRAPVVVPVTDGLMRQIGYPGIDRHLLLHEQFRASVKRLRTLWAGDNSPEFQTEIVGLYHLVKEMNAAWRYPRGIFVQPLKDR